MSYAACNFFSNSYSSLARAAHITEIIAVEAYATLRYIIPASLNWLWQKYISTEIVTIPIEVTIEKVSKIAYLNIHGNCDQIEADKSFSPILLSHGDHGHPYTMLHLAQLAQKKKRPVFSLYMPDIENNQQFELSAILLGKAIEKIEGIVNNHHGLFSGILGVGHSKGAILFAHRQFVALDPRIKATCSISGRLNIYDENECRDETLKTIVQTIYAAILEHFNLPVMQIIPQRDWNASYNSMAVRPHERCHVVPGMHLSGLYTNETRLHFTEFLEEFTVSL